MRDSNELDLLPMQREVFPRTLAALDIVLSEGVAPGAVAGLWRAAVPDQIVVAAAGLRRKIPTEQPMLLETVFDLASVSKVMGAATLAALLVERRWLRWDTRIRSIFPAFCSGEIELRHLLSHTAGFVAWEAYWERLRARFAPQPVWAAPIAERQRVMRELVFAARPEAKPGERVLYSDLSFLLLGFALEEVTGYPLDVAIRRLLWEPLGLRTAFYHRVNGSASVGAIEEVAATEDCPWRGGVLQGQVHDDNTWAMGGYAGHAGAFGSVRDVLQFSRGLLQGFLSAEVQEAAWTRAASPAGCERTLGWDTPSGAEPAVSRLFSIRSVGHLGFTGTSLWIDRDAGIAVTLLTNRVHPSRENGLIRGFRPRFHQAIRQDMAAARL